MAQKIERQPGKPPRPENSVERKETPLVIIFFGLPGSGKTQAGVVAEGLGAHVYKADDDYTEPMKEAMRNNMPINEDDRDDHCRIVAKKINELQGQHSPLVVDHWFPRDRHRVYIKNQIPHAEFVLVTTPPDTRVERLMTGDRKSPISHTDPSYYVKVASIFETPSVPHRTLINDGTLEELTVKVSGLLHELSPKASLKQDLLG